MYICISIIKQVHFHSDVDHLHHHIPAKILPNSLNGELSLEDAVDLSVVPEIRSNDDFYERLSRYVYR